MVVNYVSFEAPVDFSQTLTDGVFTSDITNAFDVLGTDIITFVASRVVDDTVFVRVNVQSPSPTANRTFTLNFAIIDVTDRESFPHTDILSADLNNAIYSNSVMPVSRTSNVTRFLMMRVDTIL